jgi:hypothetical protein
MTQTDTFAALHVRTIDRDHSLELVALPALDERSRAVGVSVSRFVSNYRPKTDADRSWTIGINAPGDWFGVRVQGTRDGRSFGASQARHYFRTEAEREGFVQARIKASAARAASKVRAGDWTAIAAPAAPASGAAQ